VKNNTEIWRTYYYSAYRPPGVFEWDSFSKGTQGVLEAVVAATKRGAVTIVGAYISCNLLRISQT